jgi:hypothetical protein
MRKVDFNLTTYIPYLFFEIETLPINFNTIKLGTNIYDYYYL